MSALAPPARGMPPLNCHPGSMLSAPRLLLSRAILLQACKSSACYRQWLEKRMPLRNSSPFAPLAENIPRPHSDYHRCPSATDVSEGIAREDTVGTPLGFVYSGACSLSALFL